jgi:general secretion pathway protein J
MRSSKRSAPRDAVAGFTLIEVMIAIVIMAVLSLIAWRGLDSMSRANVQLQERSEETAQLMRTLQQLQRDLAWRTTIELPASGMEAQARDGAPSTAAGRPQAVVRLLPPGMEARRPDQGSLLIEFVRAAPAAPGRWQRVQWWLQSGTLYRAVGAAAAAYPLPGPEAADRVAVLQGLVSFELRAWEPEQGWRALPAAVQARSPASGLEIVLGARRNGGPVLHYRQVVALD